MMSLLGNHDVCLIQHKDFDAWQVKELELKGPVNDLSWCAQDYLVFDLFSLRDWKAQKHHLHKLWMMAASTLSLIECTNVSVQSVSPHFPTLKWNWRKIVLAFRCFVSSRQLRNYGTMDQYVKHAKKSLIVRSFNVTNSKRAPYSLVSRLFTSHLHTSWKLDGWGVTWCHWCMGQCNSRSHIVIVLSKALEDVIGERRWKVQRALYISTESTTNLP